MGPRSSTRSVAALLLASTACGGDPAPARRHAKPPPEEACGPGEIALDAGGCRAAGVPEEACASGFAPDGRGGCDAVMPAGACGAGQHALPGESACHAVAPCADGTWGDIPVDATTEYVDVAYQGGNSDGSAERPWTDVQSAVEAAAAGAIVAIAEGSYAGDVIASGSSVRLWGRCASKVELVGAGGTFAVGLTKGQGFEVRGVAVTGPNYGVGMSGARDVLLDGVWIHDTKQRGIEVDDTYGETSLSVRNSLVESAGGYGMFVEGSTVSVEATTVRGTVPAAAETGVGIDAQDHKSTGRRAVLSVKGCVVEQNHEVGIFVGGADATVEATLVRDNLPRVSDGLGGRGIDLENHVATGQRSTLALSGSVIERNSELGIYVGGSDANVVATVVRDTMPRKSNGESGRGIGVEDVTAAGVRSTLVITDSVVERNRDFAIYVSGSDATVSTTILRDTQARASDQLFGRGIGVQGDNGVPANLALGNSAVQANIEAGVFLAGGTATIDATLVEGTGPAASDGLFGDGIDVAAFGATPASAVITASKIANSPRVGLGCFGGAVKLGTTVLECNQIQLDGETLDGTPFDFDDLGGNTCLCEGKTATCQLATSRVAPPAPVE